MPATSCESPAFNRWRRLGYGLLGFIVLGTPLVAQGAGATFYVSPTGSDSNPGTVDRPWRHPQKCFDAGSPLGAGDICLVRNGTYRDVDGDGIVVYVRASSPSATSAAPITLKSEKPLGAVIALPNRSGVATGIHISKSNYIVEGFDISGGTVSGPTSSSAGITVAGASNTIIRHNSVHGQGWGSCTNSSFGNSGLYFKLGSNGVIVEHNKIYQVGRLRNGESGCLTDKYHHDHGIYSAGAVNVSIRGNFFYEVNRGYPIHVYKSGGATHRNIIIYNNTISGKSPTGRPPGQIALCNTLQNVQIRNNIFHDPPSGYVVDYCAGRPTATNLVISHNLTNGVRDDFQTAITKPSSGVSYFANQTNLDPRFVAAPVHDYSLRSTSPAINAGINVGLPFKGSAPDIGAYEFVQQVAKAPRGPVGLRIE